MGEKRAWPAAGMATHARSVLHRMLREGLGDVEVAAMLKEAARRVGYLCSVEAVWRLLADEVAYDEVYLTALCRAIAERDGLADPSAALDRLRAMDDDALCAERRRLAGEPLPRRAK